MKSLLIKSTLPLALFSLLVACSGAEGADEEKDDQFCKCLEAGEELNNFTEKLWDREPTKEDEEQMKKLKAKSEKECANYQIMSGDEMRRRKKLCKE